MGSAPSKVVSRSRSGYSFVSTSSLSSLTTVASDVGDTTAWQSARDFRFEDVALKGFRVKWSPPEGMDVSMYEVRIFPPDKIKSRTLVRALPHPEYTFSKLHPGTSYAVGVVAMLSNGEKASCSTAHISTPPRPPKLLEVVSEATSDAFEVQWRHSKGKKDGYEVFIQPEEGVTGQCRITALSNNCCTFTGLVSGTEYSVTLHSVANAARSEAVTTTVTTAPRHVCDLSFSDITQHEMTVKWKKPEDLIESYNLKLQAVDFPSETPVTINKIKNTFYTFNGLTAGRLYECQITTSANRRTSKPRSFIQCTVPSEVTGISAQNVDAEEALISWSEAPGDADGYDLFLTPKEGVTGETAPQAVTSSRYKFTGLLPGTTYKVGIVTNSKDMTSKRAVATFITEPGMSGGLEFPPSTSSDSQEVKWKPSKGRADSYIVHVRREDKQEDGWSIKDVYSPSCTIKELKPGFSYKVEVTSLRDGRESSSIEGTFAAMPSTIPSVFFPSDGCSSDSITCSWEPCIGGVQEYKISVQEEGRQVMQRTVSSDLIELEFSGLKPSTVYEFTVETISNGLTSPPKKGKQKTGPGEINNLTTEPRGKTELAVSWTPPDGGADDYLLRLQYLEKDYRPDVKEEETRTEHVFKDLIPGSLYKVFVTPRAHRVCGPTSNVEDYTKPGSVLNVHIPADDVTKHEILVTWWGVEGNCKTVDATLTQLHKINEDPRPSEAVIIKEIRFKESVSASDEHRFTDLEEGTVYGIRLRASGKAGTGEDYVLTQVTKYDEPKKEEKALPVPFAESLFPEAEPADSVADVTPEDSQPVATEDANGDKAEQSVGEQPEEVPEEPLVPVLPEVVAEVKETETVEVHPEEPDNKSDTAEKLSSEADLLEENEKPIAEPEPAEGSTEPAKPPECSVVDPNLPETDEQPNVQSEPTEASKTQDEVASPPSVSATEEESSPPNPVPDQESSGDSLQHDTPTEAPPQTLQIKPVLVINGQSAVPVSQASESSLRANGARHGSSVSFADEKKNIKETTPRDKTRSEMPLLEQLTSA